MVTRDRKNRISPSPGSVLKALSINSAAGGGHDRARGSDYAHGRNPSRAAVPPSSAFQFPRSPIHEAA
ncbi:hypothetical protein NDU88_001002 [Pleurodeles waltl]|uniref:Uncharacterized protein n=1 Tax=Pleurodeles waltl TaxID=8319 RepID=A0AAV7LZT1_PLEWA|nr:hypothetical protein NDU88_001002 [Pleurodeles waltl]